jgi:hypothetical protein
VTVKELNGQALATPLVSAYAYDAAGNLRTESDPNHIQDRFYYQYDDLNRLVMLNWVYHVSVRTAARNPFPISSRSCTYQARPLAAGVPGGRQ